MTATNESTSDGFTFGHHVVALIDFLGQARDLARWDYLPQSEDEHYKRMAAYFGTRGFSAPRVRSQEGG